MISFNSMIFNSVDINVIRGVVTVDHLYVRHFTVVDWFQTKPIKLKVIKLTLVVVANLACLWENCTFNRENLIYKSQANLPIQLIHCVFDWFLFFKWYVQHFLLKLSSRYFFFTSEFDSYCFVGEFYTSVYSIHKKPLSIY